MAVRSAGWERTLSTFLALPERYLYSNSDVLHKSLQTVSKPSLIMRSKKLSRIIENSPLLQGALLHSVYGRGLVEHTRFESDKMMTQLLQQSVSPQLPLRRLLPQQPLQLLRLRPVRLVAHPQTYLRILWSSFQITPSLWAMRPTRITDRTYERGRTRNYSLNVLLPQVCAIQRKILLSYLTV